ncbi:ribosome small subunit-dependent GTPase A [Candidatus Albibeggiatoa sp. nov. BB20]|uniref:ribosome small subunit-dependent GTPase A n=1 Tax=Candidatus Albibeggiatoa sp. nov. BB20 TaxID=3162723 RepID=UPI0033658591
MDKLENIGFCDWFQTRLDADKVAAHDIARVIAVHKDRYIITNGLRDIFAELAGNLLYTANYSTDLPTTGDWVYADFHDDDTHAVIHDIIPRKTLLKRKKVGKIVNFQSISANIDVALIIQSADDNFNLRRLERYLVMINENGIIPVILLSKCDLITQNEIEKIKASILSIAPQVTIWAFSSLSGENIDTIKNALLRGNTYCLLGSSGVGKTTLLNNIVGSQKFATQSVSKKQSKGRHTTTSRELVLLDNGAMIIDTPGMRELGNMSVDAGIDETFLEITERSQNCKFSNCSHTNEKGCAILSAIEAGEFSKQRYESYMKMKKESAFNEMSYAKKRKKDKNFGKLIKSTLKSKDR